MAKKVLKKEIGTILLVDKLKKIGRTEKLYAVLAKYLSRPKQKQISINLHKLSRKTKENQTVVIPGKILSVGNVGHKLTVYVHKVSFTAMEKLTKAGCKVHSFEKLMDDKPKNTILIG
ncbi:50S ribosomal protein L18e [Candidatus Woesearchaeota archaeon]|jgi:large subunit ribosomal protein L18e|nr:50S ribosomal protein L18e [Candidatus Woesearchaeota archaeon]MBT5741408.1 50S ribosomal protein L18e [Candidatus Woesearchaeota archaeon]MBT6505230.1 50S ribosomal protein L18e [Candidatus Woesearchaeota archaeon]MBT7296221.1 50S ribosomal protein L18e [Candidatus Woesearchaeota archaeon]MBT7848905.1 50S ribosomal protein L18e [Candidatus Woesearchaeota archaeon]